MNEVLPRPEKLNGTRCCELAALFFTLGFEPVDRQMSIVSGDGIPGGKLGYWRFLPQHPTRKYNFRAVAERGLDAEQAAATPTRELPLYREQAYIAAAFHNKRLLTEQIKLGTRLKLEKVGFLYLFRRNGSRAVEETPTPELLRGLKAAGTRRTELAAALTTLGFEPAPLFTEPPGSARIQHEEASTVWIMPPVSADGQWQLAERMFRFNDDTWCAREDNTDPIACMADGFWNLRHLLKDLSAAQKIIRVQNGSRTVLLSRGANQRAWDEAAKYLKNKR